MLESWIIEQIRKREQADKGAEERARIDTPVPVPSEPPKAPPSSDEQTDRGVTVIDI